MPAPDRYPRHAEARLIEALSDSPVVLIHGPRQCGKTTLARVVGKSLGYTYLTFDDEVPRRAAETDPTGFVSELPDRTILDEIQRVPAIFSALKSTIDRRRVPGRFMLAGSANVFLVPSLSDSLAGRMDILRLHPLAQCEITRRPSNFLDVLFSAQFKLRQTERLGERLRHRIAEGGYPAALARTNERRMAAWYRDYLDAIVQRDVREIARISSLDAMPRLLALAATQTARLLNVTDLAAPFQLSRPTIRDYMTILERLFLLEPLPPWHSNRLSRLIKTPKLHLGDTGFACALLGVGPSTINEDRTLFGQLLETFVFQELRRQASWHDTPHSFYHFRDKDAAEVDIVIERGARALVGIEVKASATVTSSDFKGMRKLRDAAGKRFACGIVVYDGEMTIGFGEAFFAVPVRALWET
jgi:predicted AAA+ superfamily ATPase